MRSIMVETTSRDYPVLVNADHIQCAYVEQCLPSLNPADSGFIKNVTIYTITNEVIQYGKYKTKADAIAALEQLGNLLDLGG